MNMYSVQPSIQYIQDIMDKLNESGDLQNNDRITHTFALQTINDDNAEVKEFLRIDSNLDEK